MLNRTLHRFHDDGSVLSTAGLVVKMTTMQPCANVSCTCAAKVKVAHVLKVADVKVLLVGLLILIDPLHMH